MMHARRAVETDTKARPGAARAHVLRSSSCCLPAPAATLPAGRAGRVSACAQPACTLHHRLLSPRPRLHACIAQVMFEEGQRLADGRIYVPIPFVQKHFSDSLFPLRLAADISVNGELLQEHYQAGRRGEAGGGV